MGSGFFRAAALLGATLFLAAPAAPQRSADATPLGRIERGLWELRGRSDNVRLTAICLGDRSLLLQVQHGSAPCTHVTIESGARSATVHYTCPAAGFGRTTARVETPRLVQVESQGIHRNAPFALRAEARRIGPCRP